MSGTHSRGRATPGAVAEEARADDHREVGGRATPGAVAEEARAESTGERKHFETGSEASL